jgi:hypothetical protein
LRTTAQDAILAIARAIINSDSESSQAKITEFFQAIFKKFVTMRRSQIPSKWIEEVIVNRFPQFFLPSLWEQLIGGVAATSTNAFVRNELVEMVITILKKFHSSDSKTQDALFAHFPQLIGAFVGSLDESIQSHKSSDNSNDTSNNGKGKNNKKKDLQAQCVKKLRSALTGFKTTIDCVVKSKRDSKTILKSLQKARKALESAKEFAAKTQGVSPAIGQLSEQSLAQITSLIGNVVEETDVEQDKKQKKDKKATNKEEKVEEQGKNQKKDKKRQNSEVVDNIDKANARNEATSSAAKKPKVKK